MSLVSQLPSETAGSSGPHPASPQAPDPLLTAGATHGTPSLRRVLEVLVSMLLLVLLFPVAAVIALGIRFSSRGPVLFRHERVGQGERPFHCLKFRTMVADAPQWLERDPELLARYRAGGYKLPNGSDPRVTGIGGLLRKSHLDELPQLWNVFRGEMALVGPRPVVAEELAEFGEGAALLLSVRPGVFGAWTALGSARPGYPERARVELEYVRTRSGWGDLMLLLRNLPVLARGQGGHA